MNRAENPKEIIELLQNNFYPKTSYYGIVVQAAVTGTMFGQEAVAHEFCGSCQGVCCYNKNHLHIADVLRFYYSGLTHWMPQFLPLPEGDRCKMLGPIGCSLTRIQRPLVCVSYFCEPVAERYTELYILTRQLRAAMEALVKVWRMETGEVNRRSMPQQERILEGLQKMAMEYKREEKSRTERY
jgi:Fe-S-cluster containining protein